MKVVDARLHLDAVHSNVLDIFLEERELDVCRVSIEFFQAADAEL